MTERTLFDIPADVTYLNCANLGPRLRTVSQAGMDAIQTMASPWRIRPSDWFAGAERLRTLAADIMGAEMDCVALVPAASYGIAVAAANVGVAPGQTIIVLDGEFPSNVYAWRDLARQRGARLVTVQRDDALMWTDSVLAAIDTDTAVVALPNCHWTDGSLVDLEAISTRVRAVGAALVIDASQSLGAYPLDIARIQPDFLVSVGYKWLLGPYGLGYLYVAPRYHAGTPLERSWLSRRGSEDFARLVDYTDDYRSGARRFDMGEFPQFHLAPMACAALEQILAWGVASIHRALTTMTEYLIRETTDHGFAAIEPRGRAGHFVGLRRSGGIPPGVASALAAEQIYVSVRGDAIRVAPHRHNSTDDIDRLAAVLGSHRNRSRSEA